MQTKLIRRRFRSALTLALVQLSLLVSSLEAAAITFTTGFTITETNFAYDGQDIVISGATIAIDGPQGFNSLLLTNGAVLTHSPCTITNTHKLDLVVTNEIVVSTNSRIDVSGLSSHRPVRSPHRFNARLLRRSTGGRVWAYVQVAHQHQIHDVECAIWLVHHHGSSLGRNQHEVPMLDREGPAIRQTQGERLERLGFERPFELFKCHDSSIFTLRSTLVQAMMSCSCLRTKAGSWLLMPCVSLPKPGLPATLRSIQ